jgi:hypothetical protein
VITVEDDEIILSTGKRVYVHGPIVGLALTTCDRTDNLKVFFGSDGSIPWPVPEWVKNQDVVQQRFITDPEMKELATFMAEKWKQLADSLS